MHPRYPHPSYANARRSSVVSIRSCAIQWGRQAENPQIDCGRSAICGAPTNVCFWARAFLVPPLHLTPPATIKLDISGVAEVQAVIPIKPPVNVQKINCNNSRTLLLG